MSYPKVPIGELVSLRQGFAINKNTKHHISDEPTALPLLRIADMKDKVQNVFVKDTIPAHFIAKPEDIIYTRTGQVGLVFTDQYGVIHNNCFTVTPNDPETLNRYYLYYVLQSEDFYSAANNLASGAAQPDLPHGAFRSIEIPIPPLPLQIRIAEILKVYDDLIENNQKQIKLLEEAAQRLYKEWFVDLRFPGHETTPITDGIPYGWGVHKIGERFDTYLGGTPSRVQPQYWQGGTIPWINSGKVNELRVVEPSEYITELALNKSATKLLPVHTTLVAITGATLGQVSYTEITTCANQSVVGIVDPSTCYEEYIYCYVSNNIKQIISKATGGAQQHINKDIVNAFDIVLPDEKLMASFKNQIAPLFEKIKNLLFQNIRLTEARDRLLPKLMNGEIEV